MARRWATLCRAGPLPHRQASQPAASKSRHVVRRSGHGARKFRLVGFLRYSHAPGVLPLASEQRMQAQRAGAQSRAGRPSGRACRQQRAQQAAGHAGQHKGERAAVAAGSADQAPQRAQRGRAQRLAAAVARGRLALRRLQARGYLLLWRIAAHVLM